VAVKGLASEKGKLAVLCALSEEILEGISLVG